MRWKLTDLDAAATIGAELGYKRSTGYDPPELVRSPPPFYPRRPAAQRRYYTRPDGTLQVCPVYQDPETPVAYPPQTRRIPPGPVIRYLPPPDFGIDL